MADSTEKTKDFKIIEMWDFESQIFIVRVWIIVHRQTKIIESGTRREIANVDVNVDALFIIKLGYF